MKKANKTLIALSLGLIFSLSSLAPQLNIVKQSNSSNNVETTTTVFNTNTAAAKTKKELKNTNKHNCFQLAGGNEVCLTP